MRKYNVVVSKDIEIPWHIMNYVEIYYHETPRDAFGFIDHNEMIDDCGKILENILDDYGIKWNDVVEISEELVEEIVENVKKYVDKMIGQ